MQHYTNPDTGLLSWQIREPGFNLQLLQVLPDYVRASYSARGLPPDIVDTISAYCVFGTIVTNNTTQQVSYRVADWRYITADGRAHPLKTKTQWASEWKDRRVAFRWSILPDDQTFEPGDWSQGFTTIPLPPGNIFDLVYTWNYQGKTHTGRLEELHCAVSSGALIHYNILHCGQGLFCSWRSFTRNTVPTSSPSSWPA